MTTTITPDAFELLEETDRLLDAVEDQLIAYTGHLVDADLDHTANHAVLQAVWAQRERIKAALREETLRLHAEMKVLNVVVDAMEAVVGEIKTTNMLARMQTNALQTLLNGAPKPPENT